MSTLDPTVISPHPPPPAMAPSSTSVSDGILHSISDPSLAKADLPSQLAALLGLAPRLSSSSVPPPPPSRARTAATPAVGRSTTAKSKAAASSTTPDCLGESEGCKLAMRIVNGSLQTLTSLVQTAWSPNPQEAKTQKPKPAAETMSNPFNPPPPSLDNMLAVVACVHLALAKLRERKKDGERADLSVERVAVSLVQRTTALGLIEAAITLLEDSYPLVLTLYSHDPLPPSAAKPAPLSSTSSSRPPSTTATKKKAPVRVASSAATSRSVSSTAASKARNDAPPATTTDVTRLLWLPTPTEEPEETVTAVLVGWALCALVAVVRSCSATEDGLERVLVRLQSPYSVHSFAIASLARVPVSHLPSHLLPAIRLLSNPPITPANKSSAQTLFELRSISLELLVRLPALQPKLLWEQALRNCQVLLRAGQGVDEIRVVNTQLSSLVSVAQQVSAESGNPLLDGADWIKMTELWIKIATKLDDSSLIHKISRLLDTPPATPTSKKPVNGVNGTSAGDAEPNSDVVVARTSAALAQASATVEAHLGKAGPTADSTKLSSDLTNMASRLVTFSETLSRLTPSDAATRLIKIYKPLEKARRSCLNLIGNRDTGSAEAEDVRALGRDALERSLALVETFKFGPEIDPSAAIGLVDFCTFSVDTLLSICRIDVASAPSSGLAHLRRALSLCEKYKTLLRFSATADETDSHSRPLPLELDFANLARCISGSAYNCAVALYRAGSVADAIDPLVIGCTVGAEALAELGEKLEGQGGEEVWVALRDSLSRRWELLSSCYLKSGNKLKAHETLLSAVTSVPSSAFDKLLELSASGSLSDAFADPAVAPLAGLIGRITNVAVSDLTLPPDEVSLLRHLQASKSDPAVIGAILEQQVTSLESVSPSPEAAAASAKLIEDALEVYEPDEFPVRRVRLLARAVQQSCFQPASGSARHVSVEREVTSLCERQSFASDSKLTPFLAQYRGLSHLWLAVEAHCFSSGSSTQSLLRHASESAKSFRSALVLPDPAPAAVEAKIKSPLAVTNRQPKERAPPKRAARATKVPPLATPAPKSRVIKGSVKTPVRDVPKPAPVAQADVSSSFDDLGQFLSHLDSFANLLGLLGHSLARIEQLKIIRSLTRGNNARLEPFLSASAALGTEYLKLSKSSRAAAVFSSAWTLLGKAPADAAAPASQVEFLLRYADFLAHEGKPEESIAIYQEALEQSSRIVDAVASRSAAKIRERSLKLERAALALTVAASIHRAKDDFPSSVACLTQAHRLWTRAISNLARLSPSPADETPSTKQVSNPFEVVNPPIQATSADDLARPKPRSSTDPKTRRFDGTMWRASLGLLDCLFALSETSARRGTARDTEFFLQEAFELARSANSTVLASRALAGRGLLSLLLGKEEECDGFVVQGRTAAEAIGERNVAEFAALEGQLHLRSRRHLDALEAFEIGIAALRAFDAKFELEEKRLPGSRTSIGESSHAEPVYLPLLAQLLRCKASILRETASFDPSSLLAVSDQLDSLPSTAETRSEDHSYAATVALRLALDEFKADLTMSSLTESTISMPMGTSTGTSAAVSKARKDVRATLTRAENAFDVTLASDVACGRVQRIREACLSLSRLRAFQTSLGQSSSAVTAKTAWALDHSSAITLSRELVEIVASKFKDSAPDDLVWPDLQPELELSLDSLKIEDSSSFASRHASMRSYWAAVKTRHISNSIYSTPGTAEMPSNWSVVTINVTDDQSTLFVSRHRQGSDPLVFCLPLDRQGRRDGEDETFTFLNATEELQDIIAMSDEGAKNAKDVEGKDGRLAWWADRRDLDKRLQELLSNIEFCWLGAFKTILSRPSSHSASSFSLFRTQMEKLFTKALSRDQDRRKLLKIKLDDNLLECFSSLSPQCKDEELEDLVYFVLDLYQVHGAAVALAEIDIDQLVTDLRAVLEESEQDRPSSSSDPDDHHTFLVLDRHVQSIPWESLPSLRGRSISRIPSLAFLTDRLQLAKHLAPAASDAAPPVDGFSFPLDVKNGFYVLNPSGDLRTTEATFGPWVERMKKQGWQGIVGRAPTELELADALGSKDIVVYFGHGGGEQYIRSHKIRSLPRCATVMLWGCSSGALRDYGEFDRAGTPWNYMLAGCPSLVANLWDVTDKDIDRLSEQVFRDLGVGADSKDPVPVTKGKSKQVKEVKTKSKAKAVEETTPMGDKAMTTAQAVGRARNSCKLPYLTGAAVVVYGVPVRL